MIAAAGCMWFQVAQREPTAKHRSAENRPEEVELIVAKTRNGPIGTVRDRPEWMRSLRHDRLPFP
jgi:hypothetical protein